MKKLSDQQFWTTLRESAGIYAFTVRLIKEEYNIDITRQGVRDRALKRPEELKDIKEEGVDIAEEGLQSLMKSKNEAVRFKAIQLYLKTQGKDRGWIERQELDVDVEADRNFTVEFIMPE